MPKSAYLGVDSDGSTTFSITPASAPWPVTVMVLVVILFLFGLAALHDSFGGGLLILIVPAAILAWILKRNRRLREPMSFTVDANGIQVGGSRLPWASVHRLVLRNHVTEREVIPDVTLVTTPGITGFAGRDIVMGATAGGVMMSHASRQAWDRKRALVSWRLDADAGGQATTLGCGMDEVTAYGLLRDTGARRP